MTVVLPSEGPAAPGDDFRRSRLVRGLTAAAATARGAVISDVGYSIAIDLSGLVDGDTFRVRTEVTFSCAVIDGPVWLDLVAAQVTSVRHNGIGLNPAEVVGPERLILTAPARRNTVVVESLHRAGTEAAGLCRSVDASDGTVYAWTQFQPFDARRMFACFDQPDIRGTIRMSVTAPTDWTCLSNGSPVATATVTESLSRTDFTVVPAIPAYLVAVCAGPFASARTTHRGITLGVHARASLAADLAASAPELFAVTSHGLDRFTEAFGIGYPLDSYDQVFLPDQPGAMENMGCVTWSDASIFRAASSTAQRARRALVLLHELSHQWFGNLVSPRWWDDLWLSESFANWAAVYAIRGYDGLTGYPETEGSAHIAVAMVADQLPSTHPVSRTMPDIDSVAASFDAITYAKGAVMLRQLIDLVGEDGFLAGVRGYLRRFGWSCAAIDGLVDEVGRVTGVDVRRWAVEWLRTAGINMLTVDRLSAGAPTDTREAPQHMLGSRVVVRQQASNAWPLLRSHRLSIGRYTVRDDRLVPAGLVAVTIAGRAETVDALTDIDLDEVLLPNEGLTDYVKVRTDSFSLHRLLALGHTLTDRSSRVALRSLMADMLFDGEIASTVVVPTLVRMAATEADDGALGETVDRALEAAHDFTRPERCGALGAQVAQAGLDLAANAGPGESRWFTGWRGVVRSAWTRGQTDALQALIDTDVTPQALRWQALIRLLALGLADAGDIERERHRDPDPDAGQSALIASAAMDDGAAKWAALDVLLSPSALPIGSLARLGDALWQVHQTDALRPLVCAYFDRLPRAIAAGGPARAMRLTRWAFPKIVLDDDSLASVEKLAADSSLPEIARQGLSDQAAISIRRRRTAELSA
jgi:aminopeptidase N